MEINIGQEFNKVPSGRYRADGPASGEHFRESFLKPALLSLPLGGRLKIVIDDGVEGYGSSFLEEGFAGIVREGYLTSDELLSRLDLTYSRSDFEFYRDIVYEYIREAGEHQKSNAQFRIKK